MVVDFVSQESSKPLDTYRALVAATKPRPVLEIGTMQSVPGQSTHRMAWFPHIDRNDYVMADIGQGDDVDVVCDIHNLPDDWQERFQSFLALSVFQHLERPWIAAREINRILKPGGYAYIETHQTFPLHGFPNDFFRFSTEALSLLFRDAGFDIISAGYMDRCQVTPPPNVLPESWRDQWNSNHPSFIRVHILVQKSYAEGPRP